MFLIINTANDGFTEVILASSESYFKSKKFFGQRNQSEKLLSAINGLAGRDLGRLKGIAVVSGPGSFSSLRIGVATANALAYALKIPVAGIKINEFKNNDELVKKMISRLKKTKRGSIVLPEYGREPNITIKKFTPLSRQLRCQKS
ncbi:MAG: tRNA (adenosine(37)-N6)-threonylcarbamoyltransferase complex dimerization subunit type 1 TsaB [Patescibacteria group bacterium]